MKMFVLIETDAAITCVNDGRPEISLLDEALLHTHVQGYTSPCCIEQQPAIRAWIDGAKPGDWLDAKHMDDEIYVCVDTSSAKTVE
jgi:hypothetical protein